jgi:hypothetical protein
MTHTRKAYAKKMHAKRAYAPFQSRGDASRKRDRGEGITGAPKQAPMRLKFVRSLSHNLRRFVVLQFELQRFVVEKLGPQRPILQRFCCTTIRATTLCSRKARATTADPRAFCCRRMGKYQGSNFGCNFGGAAISARVTWNSLPFVP